MIFRTLQLILHFQIKPSQLPTQEIHMDRVSKRTHQNSFMGRRRSTKPYPKMRFRSVHCVEHEKMSGIAMSELVVDLSQSRALFANPCFHGCLFLFSLLKGHHQPSHRPPLVLPVVPLLVPAPATTSNFLQLSNLTSLPVSLSHLALKPTCVSQVKRRK